MPGEQGLVVGLMQPADFRNRFEAEDQRHG